MTTPLPFQHLLARADQSSLSILIADDEPSFTNLLMIMLKSMGHKVVATARNGHEAIQLAETKGPDLILMDIGMPGIDGITAAEKILAKKSLPIIIITGTLLNETMDRIGPMKIESCLIKPFSKEQLRSAIGLAMIRHQTAATMEK